MKTKLLSLWLALALAAALCLTGCNVSTPQSVGTIGDVEIGAGLYLLAQYNNYSTAAGAATLATGETANDVKAVLKAPASGTIGDEEFSGTGEEYLARLVARDLDYYAAVETELAAVQENTDSLWESNGELYAANGIGKETLKAYVTNNYKAQALLDLYYGPDGTEPVDTAELESFIRDECLYVQGVQFPLIDYSTYAFADDEQTDEISAVVEECAAALSESAPAGTVPELVDAAMQTAAAEYVPQAMEILGSSEDASTAALYTVSSLLLPDEIDSYTLSDESNALRDAFTAAGTDVWTTVDMTSMLLAARCTDPLAITDAAALSEQYNVLQAMCGDALDARLYADGAALPHALDQSAVNTYKAANIKRTV